MTRLLFALALLSSLFCLPQSGEDAQAGLCPRYIQTEEAHDA